MIAVRMYAIAAAMLLLGCASHSLGQENVRGNIPEFLIDCYRQDQYYKREHRFAMTMTSMISLVRKVELYAGANMDIRSLATTLLHRFRMDGIERNPNIVMSEGVTPYRPSGRQFNKHKILLKQLIPGGNYGFPNDSLTTPEKCALHFMLSSSVDPWERGDEAQVCPLVLNDGAGKNKQDPRKRQKLTRVPMNPSTSGAQISRCPIEEGVVWTSRWGAVSPGPLLAGIAAGLEHQEVKISELLQEPTEEERLTNRGLVEKYHRYQMLSETDNGLVDSIWAATLAGDLAEVAVWQGPRLQQQEGEAMFIGPDGTWNDTHMPKSFYMKRTLQDFWEMTDAETRGGADGLILGSQIKEWKEKLQRLKLSQLLEMYYSDLGVNFDPSYRACKRWEKLREIVTPAHLLVQTSNFARVLSYQLGNVQIEDDTLNRFCEMAVRAAVDHETQMLGYQQCGIVFKRYPRVHLTVILDGTWAAYDALALLAYLAEEADVSHYGSSIAIINGKTGDFMLNRTNDPTAIYENVTLENAIWPISLDLGASLSKAYDWIDFEMTEERKSNKIGGAAHVVVVLAYSSTISSIDFVRSQEKIAEFRRNTPDVRLMYLTSDVNTARFEELLTTTPNANDEVIQAHESCIDSVVPLIVHSLIQAPGRVMSSNCGVGGNTLSKPQFEDYVLPSETKQYRIHPQYLGSDGIKIWIRGSGYGNLEICLARDIEDPLTSNCTQHVLAFEQIEFAIGNPCGRTGPECKPVFLSVTGRESMNKCTEDDCRFPHQIRFTILHEGLNCVADINTGLLSAAAKLEYPNTIFLLSHLMPIFISLVVLR